jgi:hypothetical protein
MDNMDVYKYAGTNPTECDPKFFFNVVERLCNPIKK